MYIKHWRYKNLTIFVLSIIVGTALSKTELFSTIVNNLHTLGYLGAFIAGAMFVSTFVIPLATLIFLDLSKTLSPIEIALVGGLGALAADFMLFHFIRDDIIKEVRPIYHKLAGDHFNRLLHTRYFNWTLPLIGTLLIAIPFFEEIGVGLMGIARMKTYTFIVISYVFNAVAIFLLVSAISFLPF